MEENRSLKILHVISGGDTGGAKTHVIALLTKLKQKVNVDLVCFMEGVFTEEAKSNGIHTIIYSQRNRFDIFSIVKLSHRINREKYDLIHCHGARANFVAMFLKLLCKVPIVTTIHSDYKLDFQSNLFKKIVFTNMNALSLRFMDYYIGVSNSFKNMMIERGFPEHKVFTVYNGIEIKEKIDHISREAFFNKYGISYNKPHIYVGIIARLHPVKGHRIFIGAAVKAYEKNKNLRFIIAGDGAEEGRLKEYVKQLGMEHVIYFVGFIDNPYDYFNAIDINTLTSFSESFPYVLLEGAMMKKATIASRVGGIRDIIIDGKTGYGFEPGDINGLSDCILQLTASEEKRTTMGINLYDHLVENFSIEKMIDTHITIYREILKDEK
ncbi:MAG: glycosyltransferase [Thermotaleaceae bacterium]